MKYLARAIQSLFPWWFNKQTATVRYAFPLILTIVTMVGAASVLTSKHTQIVIETSKDAVYQDELVEIDVFVVATVAINAVNIIVDVPSDQLKIESLDTGNSVITLWTQPPSYSNGKVTLSGGTYRRGFIGKHKIATIKARSLTTGITKVTVNSAEAYAGDGTGQPVTLANGGLPSVSVYLLDGDQKMPVYTLDGEAGITIMGDLDGDGKITLVDISIFMGNWQSKQTIIDLNGDNRMSFRDFSILLARFFFQ